MRRGQMQALSIVLLTVVIMGLVGAAYMWAVPIIERNAAITEYTTVERFILELSDRIVELANSGSGEYTLDIPSGILMIEGADYPGGDNNTIMFDFFSSLDMLCNKTACNTITGGIEIPIETDNTSAVGVYGEDEPRVITLTGQDSGAGKLLTISLHYRELRSETRGYRIAICPDAGCSEAVNGTGRIMLEFDKRTEDPGASPLPLVTNYITVRII